MYCRGTYLSNNGRTSPFYELNRPQFSRHFRASYGLPPVPLPANTGSGDRKNQTKPDISTP